MMDAAFNEQKWRGILPRMREAIRRRGGADSSTAHPRMFCVWYSSDWDWYLDMDNPEAEGPASTTVRQELRKAGIKQFVRLPESTKLTNYMELEVGP